MDDVVLSVGEFVALTNQTLEYAYPFVTIEGEVSSFNVNQGKFVFFDVKDEEAAVGCFMMVFQLKVPIEDGMQVRITASPKLTKKGRFSLTVRDIRPVGEGGLKRAFELLKAKLDKEGLFDPARKRHIGQYPQKIAVVSSEGAAGYADFIKILNSRWGGVQVDLAQVQVQGEAAPDQIVAALNHINQSAIEYDAVIIIRGGGSLEDLQAFSTEPVVRAIAASRVPTLVGVGHETDVTLAELAADVRAATPSEAAQLLVPDKAEELRRLGIAKSQLAAISISRERFNRAKERLARELERRQAVLELNKNILNSHKTTLQLTNPKNILKKGYSIARHNGRPVLKASAVKKGDEIMVQLHQGELKTEVKETGK